MPEDVEESIIICKNKQESLIKGCAYWLILKGMEKTEQTQVRIEIPKDNILTPLALRTIMKSSLEHRKKIFEIL